MSGKQMAQVAAQVLSKAAGIADAVKNRVTSGKSKSKADLPPPGWESFPVLAEMKFSDLVEKHVQLKDEIEFRQNKLKEINVEIEALMTIAGTEKVTWEDRPVSIVHSNSGPKISAEKLLLLGVPAQTIADATVEGTPYQYPLVGKPKTETKNK